MLALSACFGVHAKKSNKLLVFAKMSNAYLGALDKRRVDIHNVARVIRDMQVQVSKLLRHPDRPSNFMLLFAPELLVEPRFMFSDYMSCKRANQMVGPKKCELWGSNPCVRIHPILSRTPY